MQLNSNIYNQIQSDIVFHGMILFETNFVIMKRNKDYQTEQVRTAFYLVSGGFINDFVRILTFLPSPSAQPLQILRFRLETAVLLRAAVLFMYTEVYCPLLG